MKKNTLTKVALIVLPVLSLMAASAANSVTIYNVEAQTTAYCSYFTLVEDLALGICLPIAALLCGITLMLASLSVLAKKDGLMRPISVTSFIAMCCAVVPLLYKADPNILVVPHVAVPIAMGITCLVANMLCHKQPKTEEPKGQRLK